MAKDYNVGNIMFSILSNNSQALSSVDKLINKLKQLNETLNKTNNKSTKELINSAKVEKANVQLEKANVQLEKAKLQLEKVKKASNGEIIDASKVSETNNKIESMKEKLDSLYQKIKIKKAFGIISDEKAERSKLKLDSIKLRIDKIYNTIESKNKNGLLKEKDLINANHQLKNIDLRLSSMKLSLREVNSLFKKIFSLGRLIFFARQVQRISVAIFNMAQKAIDFDETLNKFQVSMGNYYSEAIQFVNKLTYAFNISTESVMNYMATFKNMLDALGDIDSSYTYKMSEILTRMAIDYASLFNVSIDRAMEQFQSVLSGKIVSIRTVSGYDVSENSIYSIYQQLGGKKTMRQLDQVEKRLLRIIALQQQMQKTGAVDDFSKTINNTANQLKQLKDTFVEIGMWFGQLLKFYLEPFIEYILAAAIALREMLKSLAIANGYKYETFGEGGLFGEAISDAEQLNEEVNNLKKTLLGFDQINILGSQESKSGIGEDYSLLLSKINDYNSSLGDVQNNANQIAESILTWLGYTKETQKITNEAGEEIEQVNWKLKEGATNLSKILNILKAILVVYLVITSVKILISLITTIKAIINVLNSMWLVLKGIQWTKFKTLAVSAFGAIKVAALATFSAITTAIKAIGVAIMTNPAILGIPIIIGGIIALIIVLIKNWEKFVSILKKGIKIFGAVIKNIFVGIANFFIQIANAVIEFINMITEAISNLYTWIPGLGDKGIPKIKTIQYLQFTPIPFANGGVVDSPTHALVGEYSGAKSNKEIIAPENLMREVFLEAVTPLVQAIVEGNNKVERSIKESSNKPIVLNGRKVSEQIYDDFQNVSYRRNGKLNPQY